MTDRTVIFCIIAAPLLSATMLSCRAVPAPPGGRSERIRRIGFLCRVPPGTFSIAGERP